MFCPELWGDIQRTWLPWRYRVQWATRWRTPIEGGGGFTEHGSLGEVTVWGRRRAARLLSRHLPPRLP